jgi:hypothetical protein
MEEEQEKIVCRHQDLVTKYETIVHLILTSICYSSLRRLGAILRDESDVLTVSCDCQ